MEFFFKPGGVALIGATSNKMKGGYAILKNMMMGYKGGIYPVNPRYDEIAGLKCYDTIAEVPDPVDMAIVFTPAAGVPQLIRDCGARGIKGVMVQSAGFAEADDNGVQLQEELKKAGREAGVRLWGPNCMGLFDAAHETVFSFVNPIVWKDGLISGKVSLIVQSGMLAAGFIMDVMTHGTMGLSKACSIGNKVDVNECDLLEYLIQDPDTDVIGMYLESIPEGRRFIDLCRSSNKKIVALKGGKSAKGAQAAMSHTASMAGDGAVIGGALAQAGVIEVDDFRELIDMCRTAAVYRQVESEGKGVAVLTFSGAAGIVSADFLDKYGLEVAVLNPDTIEKLKKVFPAWMPPSNPVDLWPSIEQNGPDIVWPAAVKAVLEDPGVSAVFIHFFTNGSEREMDVSPLVEEGKKAGKPIVFWTSGRQEAVLNWNFKALELGVPMFAEVQRAVRCLSGVLNAPVKSGRYILKTGAADQDLKDLTIEELNDLRGPLDEYISKKFISRAGVPVVDEKIVVDLREAESAASDFGFPIVLKGLASGQIHKTELGLVRLGITSNKELAENLQSLKGAMPDDGVILVQKQMTGSVELIAGMIRDPQFGPCVMCGFGGIFAEILDDRVFAVAPFSNDEAMDMIGRLKNQKLLNGYRGSKPVDREALARILVGLGDLAVSNPAISEIDVNPLMIAPQGPVAVDAVIVSGNNRH